MPKDELRGSQISPQDTAIVGATMPQAIKGALGGGDPLVVPASREDARDSTHAAGSSCKGAG